jgi:ribonuclease-3
MTQQEAEEVESTIGYRFSNWLLLQQAFIRKSYSQENEGQNNEVLEFLGDKVLDYVVTKKMSDWYGQINEDKEFESKLNEAQLTEIRKKLVCKTMLANRFDILDFGQYLIMGNGDTKGHAEEAISVKEDTFEAVLGAVAVDSKYDSGVLERVVMEMLDPEFYLDEGFDADENSVSQLQEWFQRKRYGIPSYEFRGGLLDVSGWDQECSLVVPGINQRFSKVASSKTKARMAVADAVLNYLDENGLLADPNDIVKNPSEENAISQLNQLYQHGFISEPQYTSEERRDEDGNLVWYVEVHVKELPSFWHGTFSSKKEGNRQLAYKTLLDVLGIKNNNK